LPLAIETTPDLPISADNELQLKSGLQVMLAVRE